MFVMFARAICPFVNDFKIFTSVDQNEREGKTNRRGCYNGFRKKNIPKTIPKSIPTITADEPLKVTQ